MFKLVLLSGLLAVTLAKPSTLVSPIVGKLISEKTIESHGNSVVHSSAPLLTPVIPLVKSIHPVVTIAAEKAVESRPEAGDAQKPPTSIFDPILDAAQAAQAAQLAQAAQQAVQVAQQAAQQAADQAAQAAQQAAQAAQQAAQQAADQANQAAQQAADQANQAAQQAADQANQAAQGIPGIPAIPAIPEIPAIPAIPAIPTIPTIPIPTIPGGTPTPATPVEPAAPVAPAPAEPAAPVAPAPAEPAAPAATDDPKPTEKPESSSEQSSESQRRNEPAQARELLQKIEAPPQFFIHQTAPATLSYLTAGPIVPALAPIAPIAPIALAQNKQFLDSSKGQQNAGKSESPQTKQQLPERFESLDNGAIHEFATGLHLAPAPVYYFPYPAAVFPEKTISSYGHSIVLKNGI